MKFIIASLIICMASICHADVFKDCGIERPPPLSLIENYPIVEYEVPLRRLREVCKRDATSSALGCTDIILLGKTVLACHIYYLEPYVYKAAYPRCTAEKMRKGTRLHEISHCRHGWRH